MLMTPKSVFTAQTSIPIFRLWLLVRGGATNTSNSQFTKWNSSLPLLNHLPLWPSAPFLAHPTATEVPVPDPASRLTSNLACFPTHTALCSRSSSSLFLTPPPPKATADSKVFNGDQLTIIWPPCSSCSWLPHTLQPSNMVLRLLGTPTPLPQSTPPAPTFPTGITSSPGFDTLLSLML